MVDNNDSRTDKNIRERDSAINLARAKLNLVYTEPSAREELKEASRDAAEHKVTSRHEQFMQELKASGKSIVEIQTAWHDYYQALGNEGKREVWREFYDRAADHKLARGPAIAKKKPAKIPKQESEKFDGDGNEAKAIVSEHIVETPRPIARKRRLPKTSRILQPKTPKINSELSKKQRKLLYGQQRAKHNLQSLGFGLACGLVFVLIFMFSFFNQRFIVPFIRPGTASATPIILDPEAASPTAVPEVIIPKINLEIPLVFNVPSTDENQIEAGLESGVVHYPTTVLPGQAGNSAYFGHSSNNIFSPGKYKFAFTLLDQLQSGDTFYITFDKKVYVYKVYDRQIVAPSDVAVLGNVPDKVATATLITCDPPGTSLNRLVVWGEQISPSPSANSTPVASPSQPTKPSQIVGNGPSLLSRLWPF